MTAAAEVAHTQAGFTAWLDKLNATDGQEPAPTIDASVLVALMDCGTELPERYRLMLGLRAGFGFVDGGLAVVASWPNLVDNLAEFWAWVDQTIEEFSHSSDNRA